MQLKCKDFKTAALIIMELVGTGRPWMQLENVKRATDTRALATKEQKGKVE